jgi:hypothetical protein
MCGSFPSAYLQNRGKHQQQRWLAMMPFLQQRSHNDNGHDMAGIEARCRSRCWTATAASSTEVPTAELSTAQCCHANNTGYITCGPGIHLMKSRGGSRVMDSVAALATNLAVHGSDTTSSSTTQRKFFYGIERAALIAIRQIHSNGGLEPPCHLPPFAYWFQQC